MIIKRYIQHRINTSALLKEVPVEYGVEIDLRTEGNDIILHHDPFCKGERFEDFLKGYQHGCLILNTKTEGMENRLTALMNQFSVKEYFFLDLSLPFLIKIVKGGCTKVAIRFSQYEPLEFVQKFEKLAEWVWVDCFTSNMLSKEVYDYLHNHFKICIVSPELQGHPLEWIQDFKTSFEGFTIDAVCTKRVDLWK